MPVGNDATATLALLRVRAHAPISFVPRMGLETTLLDIFLWSIKLTEVRFNLIPSNLKQRRGRRAESVSDSATVSNRDSG